MIRKAAAAVAVSALALLAVACGAAPEAENLGASSDALKVITSCTAPFTVLDESTPGDTGDGVRGRSRPTWSCDYYAGPPAPAGSYADDGTIASCSEATPVQPPGNLSACTAGYRLPAINALGYVEVFLCPTGMTLPPNTQTLSTDGSNLVIYDTYALLGHANNGCFTDPLSSSYDYVVHSEWAYGIESNCGVKCSHF